MVACALEAGWTIEATAELGVRTSGPLAPPHSEDENRLSY